MDSYLLQCGKYIEMNPLRAGIVSHPGEYSFSSYRYYANGKADSLLTPSPASLGLSNSVVSREQQYVAFVVDDAIINAHLLEKKLYIGSQTFIDKLQAYYQIKNRRETRGRPPKRE